MRDGQRVACLRCRLSTSSQGKLSPYTRPTFQMRLYGTRGLQKPRAWPTLGMRSIRWGLPWLNPWHIFPDISYRGEKLFSLYLLCFPTFKTNLSHINSILLLEFRNDWIVHESIKNTIIGLPDDASYLLGVSFTWFSGATGIKTGVKCSVAGELQCTLQRHEASCICGSCFGTCMHAQQAL